MLLNAAEQAAAVSKPGEAPGFNLVLCADLHSASAAELAQAQRQGGHVECGCAAVLQGAHLLACSAPRREKRLTNVTHACTVSRPESAAMGNVGSDRSPASAASDMKRQARVGALLLLVRQEEAALVTSTAGACGWQVDGAGTAALLACLQGESGGVLPLLLRTQTF